MNNHIVFVSGPFEGKEGEILNYNIGNSLTGSKYPTTVLVYGTPEVEATVPAEDIEFETPEERAERLALDWAEQSE